MTFYFQGDTTSKDRPLIIIIIIITWGFAGFYFEILWGKKSFNEIIRQILFIKITKRVWLTGSFGTSINKIFKKKIGTTFMENIKSCEKKKKKTQSFFLFSQNFSNDIS